MDALARLAPVARPLLRQVDTALATLGAPEAHPIWDRLRRLGATPADSVAYLAELEPVRLREAAGRLRTEASAYAAAPVPDRLSGWSGSAAEGYAVRAGALADHLHLGLAGRLTATASYADAVADWHQASRDQLARCLADVLGSAQAIAVRSQPSLGAGLAEALRDGGADGGTAVGLARAVLAAADIGVAVLAVAEEAAEAGAALHRRWGPELAELRFAAPAYLDPTRDQTIRLHH